MMAIGLIETVIYSIFVIHQISEWARCMSDAICSISHDLYAEMINNAFRHDIVA